MSPIPAESSAATCTPQGHGGIRVRFGDLWQLGPHRLLCGDSRDRNQVAHLLQGERARLTITSPPYNLGPSASLGNNRSLGRSKYLGEDRRTTAQYVELLCSVTENALALSDVVIVNVQMLSGNKIALLEWLYHFRAHLIDIAIWDKGTTAPAMARNVMNSRFEFLVYLTMRSSKGKTPRTLFTADFRGTVDNIYQGRQQKRNPYFQLHAATFPAHLPAWLMQTFDSSGGLVFDPFLGTGTTLLTAHHAGQPCVGMEIEPRYCNLILQRFTRETGIHPVQISPLVTPHYPDTNPANR